MIDEMIDAIKILNAIDDTIDSLPKQQSECDSKLSDLYHILENNKLDAIQCCAFVKEMQKVCLERRKVKDNIEIGKVIKNNSAKLNSKDNRQFLINELRIRQKRLETEYRNRIYTEKDLVDLKIKKEGK